MGRYHSKFAIPSLPVLPHELLRMVGEHVTPVTLDNCALRNYMMVLMTLKFSPNEVTERVRRYIALSLTPIANIGYISLGHGYGELSSLVCRSSSMLRVNGLLYTVKVSDTVTKDLVTQNIILSDKKIGSGNDVVYGRLADYSVQLQETTPGW